MKYILITLIKIYQMYISPRTPGVCRYTPTCSQYAIEAVEKYGFIKGGWLAIKRVSRCHPGCPGGYDPVP